MLNFFRGFRSLVRDVVREDGKLFRQYVGNNTILMNTNDQLYIYLDGNDASLTPSMLRERTWEPQVSKWVETNLRKGDCFVDIGGNNGIHALRAGRKVGETGQVIVFEPQDHLAGLIERSACANLMIYNFHVCRKALGAEEGSIRLGKFAHLAGSATVTANEMIAEYVEVPLATLPVALVQVAEEKRISCNPDVIKIDVEGFEFAVWDGMKEWTRQQSRLAIVLGYSPVSYIHSGRDALALLEEFVEYGFRVEQLMPNGRTSALDGNDFKTMSQQIRQYDLVLSKGDFSSR